MKPTLKRARRALLGCMTAALFTSQLTAKIDVVATTADLGALASEIGGAKVSVTVLAKPTEDPHFVDAKPSFIVKLNRADALIEGGADLEVGWLPALLTGARNSKLAPGAPGRILCSEGVEMLEVPVTLDRAQGDVHARGNPHFLVDPMNAQIAAEHIYKAFCQIDPQNCGEFKVNWDKLHATLDERLGKWQKQLDPFKDTRLVAYHNMWSYFARRFGLRIDLFLEPKPGIPPSPAHLAKIISTMQDEKIPVIIVEPFQHRRTAETVADRTGAMVVDLTQYPGGIKGTEGGYVAMMDHVVSTLSRALEKSSARAAAGARP
ncbi:MAG: metal ABC transporter substrate-binding protein [Verrucomicrobiota bacterium]